MNKKHVIVTIALMLVVAFASIGGTLAWLTDKTTEVKNTFTPSDVDIEFEETLPVDKKAKMVPGTTIGKNPKVTVIANSEACYVFVKIEESNNFDTYMTYEPAEGWTLVPGQTAVYYRTVAASAANQPFDILKDNQVAVKEGVTKAQMDALDAENKYPTLSFTTYAIQQVNGDNNSIFTPEKAWELASNQ